MIQKPYNMNVRGQTLDARDIIRLTWQVTGDLSTSFQVRTYLNSNNTLTYDSGRITSFAQNFNIPSASISNGKEYKITVTIWNQANETITSDAEIFQTSSRPVITVSQIPLIASPSYSFTANYTQAESISSRSWVVYLYNSSKVKIAQSGISTNPSINYIFSDLKSNVSYYIEFQVTSAKGLTGTTGLVSFSVSYSQPDIKINLTAENTDNAGMKVSWKTIQVIGKTTSPPIYIDGEYIDLNNDKFLLDEDFNISQDFTIKLWIKTLKKDTDILTLKSSTGTLRLQYWSNDNRFHLFKDVYQYVSHYQSEPVLGPSFFICIQQIFYDMNIVVNPSSLLKTGLNMGITSEKELTGLKVSPVMSLKIKG